MSFLAAGISTTAGVIALVAVALLRTVGRGAWPRLTVGLIVAGVTALVGTPLGSAVRGTVTSTDHWLGSLLAQWLGAAVFGLAGLACLGVLIADLYYKSITNRTLGCAAGLPLTAVTITGIVGEAVMFLCKAEAGAIGYPLAWMFGG